MLIDTRNLPQETEEQKAVIIGHAIHGILAIDDATDAHLRVSHGRRKWGRPAHYYVDAPDGSYTIHSFRSDATPDNPQGRRTFPGRRLVMRVDAFTDAEALEKVNALFEKKYALFKQRSWHEETREEGVDFNVGHAWWQEQGNAPPA